MDLIRGGVNKLYFTLLASAIGSTLVTNIYSTVDLICIGQYAGDLGSAAVSCVSPFWAFMLCLAFLAGIGGSVLMSNHRGKRCDSEGDEYFTISFIFAAIFSAVVFIVGVFLREPLLRIFGAEGEVLEAAILYMTPISYVAPTFTMCACISSFVRNDGEAMLPMIATVAGGVLNVFGDIFFVFDFGLGLGIYGAGLATALGQLLSFLITCSYFLRKKCKLRFTKVSSVYTKLLAICAIGFSVFILEVSGGLCIAIFNNIITKNLSRAHLAVYGTVSSIGIMFLCLFYSVGGALQPIVSMNYGAKNYTRVKKTLQIAIITAFLLGVLFFAITQLFPEFLLKMYMKPSEEVMKIGPSILRIYCSTMLIVGISVVASYYLQSTLRAGMSVCISLLRAFVLPIAFALLLPTVFGYDSIWYSIPISEAIVAFISVIFVIKTTRAMKNG